MEGKFKLFSTSAGSVLLKELEDEDDDGDKLSRAVEILDCLVSTPTSLLEELEEAE